MDTGVLQLIAASDGVFLFLHLQPRVNGVRSDDVVFGWGGPGGYVYQKAYVECFASPRHLAALIQTASAWPSITYFAVDKSGNTYTNSTSRVRVSE